MHIFGPCHYNSACHLHRVIYPFRYLSKDAAQHKWECGISDPSGEYDCLFVYGSQPLPNAPLFGSMKRKGVRIVYTLDDSYHQWPHWRHDKPSTENVGMVDLLAELADLIVASTPALAEELGKPKKTVIGPNLIECGAYGTPTPPNDDGPIRILFSGSATHKADLDVVDDACLQLLKKYQQRIQMFFVGSGPDRTLMYGWNKGATLIDWIPLREYWQTINSIRPHICIAPLTDCPFNCVKSNIRCLESWSLNAALVASSVGEYRVVNSEVDGLYANNEDEWVLQLSRLIEDRQLRERLAVNGYNRVLSDWDWVSPTARQKWRPVIEHIDQLSTHITQ